MMVVDRSQSYRARSDFVRVCRRLGYRSHEIRPCRFFAELSSAFPGEDFVAILSDIPVCDFYMFMDFRYGLCRFLMVGHYDSVVHEWQDR